MFAFKPLRALAAFVAVDAGKPLLLHEHPQPSIIGIVVTSISIAVMIVASARKTSRCPHAAERCARGGRIRDDGVLVASVITLIGIALNAALGWWWADPVAALGITFFLVREAREAWQGRDACCRVRHGRPPTFALP